MSNDLIRSNGALPASTDLAARFESMAAERASEMQTGMQSISCKAGVMKLGDIDLPGNQIAAIVLADVRENTYFGSRYDPNNIMPPTCYAFGRTDKDMAPDASMQADLKYFQPQAQDCVSCGHNRYGTSDTGRGKACQNRFRLIIQSAGYYAPVRQGSADLQLHYWESLEDFAAQDMVALKIPVTSGSNWAKYVKQLYQLLKKPALGVVTRIYITKHDQDQFHLNFGLLEELPPEMGEFLLQRHDAASSEIRRGYSPPDANAQQAPGAAPGRLRGM